MRRKDANLHKVLYFQLEILRRVNPKSIETSKIVWNSVNREKKLRKRMKFKVHCLNRPMQLKNF